MFSVVVRPQTYLNIFYLLLSFPLGIAYFVFLVTGLSVGFGLLIIWAISRRWLPPGWGLLDDTHKVVVAAPKKSIRKNTGIVSNVLRAIARSNTTSMMKVQGVLFTEDGAVFPQLGTNEGSPNGRPDGYQPEGTGKDGPRYHRLEKVGTTAAGLAK